MYCTLLPFYVLIDIFTRLLVSEAIVSETYSSYGQIFECISVVVCIDGRYKIKYIYLRNYKLFFSFLFQPMGSMFR